MWHQSGVVARELAERAGHSRASMTLDVYAHVMPLDEVPEAELRDRGWRVEIIWECEGAERLERLAETLAEYRSASDVSAGGQ